MCYTFFIYIRVRVREGDGSQWREVEREHIKKLTNLHAIG
jgi:hypothetical protein